MTKSVYLGTSWENDITTVVQSKQSTDAYTLHDKLRIKLTPLHKVGMLCHPCMSLEIGCLVLVAASGAKYFALTCYLDVKDDSKSPQKRLCAISCRELNALLFSHGTWIHVYYDR